MRVSGFLLVLLLPVLSCAPASAPSSKPRPHDGRRPSTQSPSPPSPDAVSAPLAAIEEQAFNGVNAHRRSIGLRPLVNDSYFAQVARAHSRAMAQGRTPMGHEGMSARAAQVRAYKPARGFAENVAKSSRALDRVADATVRNWIASPVHLRNIEGRYSTSGIGAARSAEGVTFLTQVFAGQGG